MPISFHFESFFLLAVPTPTQGDGQEPFIHPTEPPRMSGTGRGGERWTPTGSQPGAGEKVPNEQPRQWMRAGPEHGLLAAGTRKVDVEAWGPGRDSGTEAWRAGVGDEARGLQGCASEWPAGGTSFAVGQAAHGRPIRIPQWGCGRPQPAVGRTVVGGADLPHALAGLDCGRRGGSLDS